MFIYLWPLANEFSSLEAKNNTVLVLCIFHIFYIKVNFVVKPLKMGSNLITNSLR